MLELLYTALLYLIQPLTGYGSGCADVRLRPIENAGVTLRFLPPSAKTRRHYAALRLVGETLAAIPLVRALRHRYPVYRLPLQP